MAKVSGELSQTMLTREYRAISHSCHGADDHSPGQSWIPKNHNLEFFEALASAPDWTFVLSSGTLGQRCIT